RRGQAGCTRRCRRREKTSRLLRAPSQIVRPEGPSSRASELVLDELGDRGHAPCPGLVDGLLAAAPLRGEPLELRLGRRRGPLRAAAAEEPGEPPPPLGEVVAPRFDGGAIGAYEVDDAGVR